MLIDYNKPKHLFIPVTKPDTQLQIRVPPQNQ